MFVCVLYICICICIIYVKSAEAYTLILEYYILKDSDSIWYTFWNSYDL